MDLLFSNPQPDFLIKDWFFGASPNYKYIKDSSPNAQINILYESSFPVSTTIQQMTNHNLKDSTLGNVCVDVMLSAIKFNSSYYVFY